MLSIEVMRATEYLVIDKRLWVKWLAVWCQFRGRDSCTIEFSQSVHDTWLHVKGNDMSNCLSK